MGCMCSLTLPRFDGGSCFAGVSGDVCWLGALTVVAAAVSYGQSLTPCFPSWNEVRLGNTQMSCFAVAAVALLVCV